MLQELTDTMVKALRMWSRHYRTSVFITSDCGTELKNVRVEEE